VTHQQHHPADCPHREMTVGWALHALEPAGAALVAAHLPDCPTCTRTATHTEEIGATLSLCVPQTNPSANLEKRVLNATSTTHKPPVRALTPSTRPTPHLTRRLWLCAKSWLRPRR